MQLTEPPADVVDELLMSDAIEQEFARYQDEFKEAMPDGCQHKYIATGELTKKLFDKVEPGMEEATAANWEYQKELNAKVAAGNINVKEVLREQQREHPGAKVRQLDS